MKRLLLLVCFLGLVGGAVAQTRRHKFSFNGQRPSGWQKVMESRDNDGDPYEVWTSPPEQPIHITRVIYTNPPTWWKDQQYVTTYAPNGANSFCRSPVGDYPHDSVSTIAHRTHVWVPEIKDFRLQEDENDVPEWNSGQTWGNPGPPAMNWSFWGSPGVWKHGYQQYQPANNEAGFVNGYNRGYFESFWPGSPVPKAENVTNPFDADAGTPGDETPDADPEKEGWGTFLSLEWWKKLCIYLFVPSDADFQVVKDALAQFKQWGPFKLVADVSDSLGSIAGGAPASTVEAMQIQYPNFYLPGGYGPITGKLDLRPYGSYLLMVRSVVFCLAMIRIGRFWGEKYKELGSRA